MNAVLGEALGQYAQPVGLNPTEALIAHSESLKATARPDQAPYVFDRDSLHER